MNHFAPLHHVAQASLGYKSLQNDFFYVNKGVIDTYRIEERFLRPIIVSAEFDLKKYLQNPEDKTWLFLCREKEADLRGTGALRYIHAMAERPAATKKQNQATKVQKIREVLEAQGGGFWYAPKAQPHAAHLWVRKAYNTNFAPFIFPKARVVDQRCNFIEPLNSKSTPWQLLGAAITSTLFAYSVEVNGSVSMGAGALEAPTTKLRGYPLFNVQSLNAKAKKELVQLAKAVWQKEHPMDWGADGGVPGPRLRALDEWLLERAGSDLQLEQLYEDMRTTCAARITVAQDKSRTTTKQKSENIGSLAKGIAESLGKLLNAWSFPEVFSHGKTNVLGFAVDSKSLRQIKADTFFEETQLTVLGDDGKVLLEGSYDAAVAEIVIRALLFGRENFSVPADAKVAAAVLSEFFQWFATFEKKLDRALDESAVGTGYEDAVRSKVFELLRIHPAVRDRTLPSIINAIPAQSLKQLAK